MLTQSHVHQGVIPEPFSVWKQMGVPAPQDAAQGVMQASDNFGYKSKVQMLHELQHNKAPSTVWQQIGVTEPHQAADMAMQQSEAFGYKAPVQMLRQQGPPLPPLGSGMGTNRAFLGKVR